MNERFKAIASLALIEQKNGKITRYAFLNANGKRSLTAQAVSIVRKRLESEPVLKAELLKSNPHLSEYHEIITGTRKLGEKEKTRRLNFLKYVIKKNASKVIVPVTKNPEE